VTHCIARSFTDVRYTLIVEVVLIVVELLQVWAYMHQKGPMAYLLSIALGRGSSKVGAEASTPEYRSLADVPSKAFTYNFLICTHAVCEALTVIVAAYVPLVYNYNVASRDAVDSKTAWVNFIIALVGETIVADSLFCLLAGRQQRRAHTFLATWQLRPRGSVVTFVLVAAAAFLPVFYSLLLVEMPKWDDGALAMHSWPQTMALVDLTYELWNTTSVIDWQQASSSELTQMARLRSKCGVPPGEVDHEEFCFLACSYSGYCRDGTIARCGGVV